MTIHPQAQDVLDFWFAQENEEKLFQVDPHFDQEIYERFFDLWQAASQGSLFSWRNTALGRLAEIIVLDQFSRNLWRDDARSFTQDQMALVLSQELIALDEFQQFDERQKQFALMPWMHSESAAIHTHALDLFKKYTNDQIVSFELKHKELIDEFGRYPYRNDILNRESTPEEEEFLAYWNGFHG
ncbi:DUF924 family protein [Dolosicoccus paucivorans]|uniref:DUF924 domain-containing protein n=1 Tax=Dolosicoccus paucivorans TaxID=84521 RepID=A0A1G8LFJ9_9LACT|nr:DUF924 family protein [Dolosicoccus paucivorans]PMB84816.1 DUF924 domain-containing protein [Dolosicoccus paucivorans]PMC58542.1 DUF924 domain-containing protein [Dolosicoccus paucivorans]SDI54438.1 Uncharacterized conserved protein, DUF924 family [Dolosicoccus paucivorans]